MKREADFNVIALKLSENKEAKPKVKLNDHYWKWKGNDVGNSGFFI